MKKYSAVIVANGDSRRFKSSVLKPFMSLNGKPVIQYCIDVIEPLVNEIIIVSNKEYKDYKIVKGGNTRSESVFNGLMACDKPDYVIIHDGVRPFVTTKQIKDIKKHLKNGYKAVDTATEITDGLLFEGIPKEKSGFSLSLTPEGFDYKLLLSAFSESDGNSYQDEVSMVYDKFNILPKVIKGTSFNSKITYPEDLAYSEGIMRFWNESITTKPNLEKSVLIFGGSGGIGQACIKKLKNYKAPTRKELDLLSDGIKLIPIHKFDSIIYSAGEYKNENNIMRINFDACVDLIKLAEVKMWKGNIVFLSSTASTFGRKGIGLYSASKSALNAYIESRAEELANKGIYINVIAPAKVDTPLQTAINPDTPKSEMISPSYIANIILKYIDTKAYGHIIYIRKGFDK